MSKHEVNGGAQQRVELLEKLFGVFAHHSRNTLYRIQACIDMMGLEARDPATDRLVGSLQEAEDHLTHLYAHVEDFLSKPHYERERVDLNAVLDRAWAHAAASAPAREMHLDRQKGLPTCWGDEAALERAFQNVLCNAVEAGEGPLQVSVSIVGAALPTGDAVSLFVDDNGPGFDPGKKSELFEPLYSTKRGHLGLGLPLACRDLLAHSGTITAANRAEGGSRFTLTIPCD